MKRIALIVLSMVLTFGGITAAPSAAFAADDAVPAAGYAFVDVAHHGGVYVALAKDTASWTKAILYSSSDGGMTWSKKREIGSAKVIQNPQSRQQLVYWEGANVFAAHCAGTTLVSADGVEWNTADNNKKNLWTQEDEELAVSGGVLISSQPNSITAAKTVDEKASDNKFDLMGVSHSKAVAAKPADANGDIKIMIHNQDRLCEATLNAASGYQWTKSEITQNTEIPDTPLDMVYAAKADQFLSVDNTETLFVINGKDQYTKVPVLTGTAVTGIGVSDKYIVAGMADGKLYRAEHTAEGITADTIWSEIPVQSGGTACDEPIRNIEFSEDGSFLALSDTKIFKGGELGYQNIKEYKSVGKPVVTRVAKSVFEGVRLIGGTHAKLENQDVYLVYGDTTVKDAEDKYWGKIFLSNDGKNWENVYTGYTFSTHNENTETGAVTYSEAKNGAVRWEQEGKFVVSASTSNHEQVVLHSADGRTWSATQNEMQLKAHNDIAVGGGKLYSLYGRGFWTYSAWGEAAKKPTPVETASGAAVPKMYVNRLAVSGGAEPAVLMAQNGFALVRRNTGLSATETDNWKYIPNVGSGGYVSDAVYSEQLKKFVAVLTSGYKVSIVDTDGTVAQGAVPGGGVTFSAVDTNGGDFMFAGSDGVVYTAPDTADFSKSSVYTPVRAASGITENTMKVTNVFQAGENVFLATVSDDTKSDVLMITKTGADWSYTSTMGDNRIEGLQGGMTLQIASDCVNNSAAPYPFTLIAAVYAGEKLIEAKSAEQTVEAGQRTTAKMELRLPNDLPENASVKVFAWDSLDTMIPIMKAEVDPF